MKSGESVVIEDPNKYFYLNNGAVLRNLHEMLVELRRIDDSTFQHHVNTERNDFSNWTRDVLKEQALAKKLAASKSVKEAVTVLEKKLNVSNKSTNKRDKKSVISKIKESVRHG